MPLPWTLRNAFANNSWPKGRISGDVFPALKSLGGDLELSPELRQIEADDSSIATKSSLVELFRDPRWEPHLYRGADSTKTLPWLDLDLSVVIGGGADYGDDMWVVLDLRGDTDDPKVVFNQIHFDEEPERMTWHELSPSLSTFLETGAGAVRAG